MLSRTLTLGALPLTTPYSLLAITKSLAQALEQIGHASDKIKEAEQKLPPKIEEMPFPYDSKCPICGGELEEEGYEGSDGDSAWWLWCPKCRELFYPHQ